LEQAVKTDRMATSSMTGIRVRVKDASMLKFTIYPASEYHSPLGIFV